MTIINNTAKEFYLFYEVFVQFVLFSSIIRGKWLSTTQYLNNSILVLICLMLKSKYFLLEKMDVTSYFKFNNCLEHVPPELLLYCFFLPEGVQDQLAEVREVNEAVSRNPVFRLY